VPTAEDLQAWLDLQAETLDRVHASWFSRIPPALVVEARAQPLGRRWLANHLSAQSPLLFGLHVPEGAEAVADLQEVARLAPMLGDALDSALELGAMAYASIIRTTVRRADVKSVRTVLGIARYERVLTAVLPESSAPVQPLFSGDGFSGDGAGDDAVEDRLVRQGAAELLHYADRVHRAWGESVRLAFERKMWTNMPPTVLAAAATAACLHRLAATYGGGANG
jgi:hypothetical protein